MPEFLLLYKLIASSMIKCMSMDYYYYISYYYIYHHFVQIFFSHSVIDENLFVLSNTAILNFLKFVFNAVWGTIRAYLVISVLECFFSRNNKIIRHNNWMYLLQFAWFSLCIIKTLLYAL